MNKKNRDFDKIILFIKNAEGGERIVVHHQARHNRKEVNFFDFTNWLKNQRITQFSKKEFNDYCLKIAKVGVTYRGKGWFVFEGDAMETQEVAV